MRNNYDPNRAIDIGGVLIILSEFYKTISTGDSHKQTNKQASKQANKQANK